MILGIPLRCCAHMRFFNHSLLPGNGKLNVGYLVAGNERSYAKDKVPCCKDVTQTEGHRVEPWPKSDPCPPAWRTECPKDPQPPNYDPYRIKVPDVVVPPLPPSNAKCTGVVFLLTSDKQDREESEQVNQARDDGREPTPEEHKDEGLEILNEDGRELFNNSETCFDNNSNPASIQDLFLNSPVVHPDYWKDKPERKLHNIETMKQELPKLGYHGKNIYKYAFHEPWKPLDRITLLEKAERQELEGADETALATKTDERLT